jgi:acyl transferase domain-containing protein
MWNPDGRCFVFDERGSGYSRGEGVGTVILKRLDFALEDGDPVHAVILNSGLNQDGKTAGITQPNPDSQAALMEYVYESAGVNPAEALYVEAHGTVSPFLHCAETPLLLTSFQGTQAGMLSFSMHSPPPP